MSFFLERFIVVRRMVVPENDEEMVDKRVLKALFNKTQVEDETIDSVRKYINTWGGSANIGFVLGDNSIKKAFVDVYGWEAEKLAKIANQEISVPKNSLGRFTGLSTEPTSFRQLLNGYFRAAGKTPRNEIEISKAKDSLLGFMNGFVLYSRIS